MKIEVLHKALYHAALKMLARREHSRHELIQKLKAKNFDENLIQEVIKYLEQKKYLDDVRFAQSYARMRSHKGYGNCRISAELVQRGVAREVVNALLFDETETIKLIKKNYQKKYGQTPMTDLQEKAKRMNYLYRKGFDREVIRKFLKQISGKEE